MSVEYRYSPVTDANNQRSPLVFTAEPWKKVVTDVYLLFRFIFELPNIVRPIYPTPSGELDELSITWGNTKAIAVHIYLIISQLSFLVSLLFFAWIPTFSYIAYCITFVTVNHFACRILNGNLSKRGLVSRPQPGQATWPNSKREKWLFLNGVAVGEHWLQNNVDMIARIFRRPVIGIHNKTDGIIFDIIQCLIERCFQYSTDDVRHSYTLVKQHIYDPDVDKIVLILHSQGAIQGTMIVDWLLTEIPSHRIKKIEVYTFGNATNHFNNPINSDSCSKSNTLIYGRLGHVEHYANSKDFVSLWGILHFMRVADDEGVLRGYENRFRGQLFVRPGRGHQFNQHYLDNIFPLHKNNGVWKVREPEDGDFMSMKVVDMKGYPVINMSENARRAVEAKANATITSKSVEVVDNSINCGPDGNQMRVYEMSRLWEYRNGGGLQVQTHCQCQDQSNCHCQVQCGVNDVD